MNSVISAPTSVHINKRISKVTVAQHRILSCVTFTNYVWLRILVLTKFIDSMKLEHLLNTFRNRIRIQTDLDWLNK